MKKNFFTIGVLAIGGWLLYKLVSKPTTCTEGETKCMGTDLYTCQASGEWLLTEANSEECGYVPPGDACEVEGATKCVGFHEYLCENGVWQLYLEDSEACGAIYDGDMNNCFYYDIGEGEVLLKDGDTVELPVGGANFKIGYQNKSNVEASFGLSIRHSSGGRWGAGTASNPGHRMCGWVYMIPIELGEQTITGQVKVSFPVSPIGTGERIVETRTVTVIGV